MAYYSGEAMARRLAREALRGVAREGVLRSVAWGLKGGDLAAPGAAPRLGELATGPGGIVGGSERRRGVSAAARGGLNDNRSSF